LYHVGDDNLPTESNLQEVCGGAALPQIGRVGRSDETPVTVSKAHRKLEVTGLFRTEQSQITIVQEP
jgi:hypothetical protein